MRLALYQPDIAGNVGTILRLGACLGVAVDLIEPMGFAYSDRALARAGMDYARRAEVARHADWEAFLAAVPGRIVLLSTRGGTRLDRARFAPGDTLLLGSEGAGVPEHVHARAELSVRIPLTSGMRALNVAVAAGIALGEALRQTGGWPEEESKAMDDPCRFERRRMEGASFRNVSLAGAVFDDVNLGGARFGNVNLAGAAFEDINLSGVTIDNANIKGLRIFGYDVEAMIEERLERDCRDKD
jgi:tRNA (cytidine/uridine-2'-O-)-methyltransferase